jgi:hypothetical protein
MLPDFLEKQQRLNAISNIYCTFLAVFLNSRRAIIIFRYLSNELSCAICDLTVLMKALKITGKPSYRGRGGSMNLEIHYIENFLYAIVE